MKKIIIILLLLTLTYSIVNIIIWNNDNIKTQEIITQINNKINPSNTKRILDINYLINKNTDTVAYIIVNNTNISYPILKTTNNSFYLNHSFDKTYSNSGWVFMDYKNNNFNDQNTVIYAHARLDGTMFGTLKNVLKKNWYNNKDNHIITIITKDKTIYYQVFSTYTIDTEDYYIQTSFKDKNEYSIFLNTIQNRSIYNYNLKLNTNDKILTLSSCYTNNKKVVLHAKLIQIKID